MLSCADCGFNMRAMVRKDPRKDGSVHTAMDFICGNYGRSGKSACTVHTINEGVLIQLVLEGIRAHAELAVYDEQRVMDAVLKKKSRETSDYLATYKRELKACEERLAKLDGVTATLYEDRVAGVVTDTMFSTLMHKYESERTEKADTAKILRSKVEACEKDNGDVSEWIKLIRKYAGLETLTQKILLELIDSIEVFEAQKVDGQRVCKVNIAYRFVGNVDDVFTEMGGSVYEQAV